MLLLIISAAITVFLLAAAVIVMLGTRETIETRLMDVTSRHVPDSGVHESRIMGVAGAAGQLTSLLKPLRNLITSSDEDLSFRLALAGLRKPEYVEIYVAAKMLLPVFGLVVGTFIGTNIIFAIMGGVVGFFIPDFVVTQMVNNRRESIRMALPDALDLLVICMEAGLGIDQALVRVGEEVQLSCPALAEELQIIGREQRAGKPRLEAWRGLADRLDIDYVRQFVTMLIQTERFGTPIANALGQFADGLRLHRTQAAEEMAAKTGVKLLFPLVLFIFPSLFVVMLGPAILNISKMLTEFLK